MSYGSRSVNPTDIESGEEPTIENTQVPSISSISDIQTMPVEVARGTIEKIILSNFMCHSELELTFRPKANIVVGKNGSGKTAIMAALAICLGRTMNKPLHKFIKEGCSSATIEVHLSNHGIDAFRPSLYGRTIVIQRTIFSQCHSYKIRTLEEGLVRSVKPDVDKILKHFCIDVENPVTFVTDNVSDLLDTSEKRYKFSYDTLYRQIPGMNEWRNGEDAKLTERKWLLDASKRKVEILEQQLVKVPEFRKCGADIDNVKSKLNGIRQRYFTALDHYKKMNKEYKEYNACKGKLLAKRLGMLKMMCMRISRLYQMFLSHHGLDGSLRINHSKETVDLSAAPERSSDKLDHSLLSRGEKSLSKLLFILAHRETIECPFQCWDDFDAGMDMVCRSRIIKTFAYLAGQTHRQFVLSTRQSIIGNLGDNVKVHRF